MKPKNVAVIGAGYVGLVTGACLPGIGSPRDLRRFRQEESGGPAQRRVPIYEPGLPELVTQHRKAARLSFTGSIEDAMRTAEVVFIAVNTPPSPDGGADLSYGGSRGRAGGTIAPSLHRHRREVDRAGQHRGPGPRHFCCTGKERPL